TRCGRRQRVCAAQRCRRQRAHAACLRVAAPCSRLPRAPNLPRRQPTCRRRAAPAAVLREDVAAAEGEEPVVDRVVLAEVAVAATFSTARGFRCARAWRRNAG